MRVAILILGLVLGLNAWAEGEHTRATVSDALGVEVLGRGLLWGVTYDRAVNDDMAAGFGFGTVGTKNRASGVDTNTPAYILPVYFNYYFLQEQGAPFVTGGANVVLNNSEVKTYKAGLSTLEFSSAPVIPTLGFGYENRSETGFMVRGTAYALIGDNVAPWFGFYFGYVW
jgi:hypothetical protein